jgi:hypothetical protein
LQIPIFLGGDFFDRTSPDTSVDFSNLFKYPEYKNNRDRVEKAEILQVNYRIDSLIFEDGTVYNPLTDDIEFEYVKYSLQFAKSITGNEQSTNPADYVPDPNKPVIVLGEFKNVNVREYYRQANRIIEVPEASAKTISDGLKVKPYFYIYTEYSKVKGQTVDEIKYKLIRAKFDLILRLEVKL